MTTFMRLKTPFQARSPITALSAARTQTPRISLYRSYATKSSNDPEQATTTTRKPNPPSRPIPSNKAKPTLIEGEQSHLVDREGNPRKDLPQDVKKHNRDMEERYDKPYNSTDDDGTVKPAFKS
ncbi:hypothetical protein E8E15_003006 [Penicillium rubens]|jgi:hypothetical protein|uniref:Pc18g01530 protein n=2 Tax=Penicillium chrysogenum species complex TaxID=254878 RepID=B6HCF3_PENRW|nr:uncharacterized protein N7525_000825 [Penicillium rubens]XP_056566170.1 uncharacterized protein N7489_006705 [Penicillium chrysogenum]CAP94377.1 Pc18g01530 [Penicillium rubens Wisconsin 54-1255]KAF3022695.1 hypothetical protein E8E15_003006 [Penicillium rubens]KAJ5039463.1 hypothetical protein NUH16_009245 [Penicillium rubens]KAJ5236614.1 hypothetical protein N7489_006705 [Penicillium chrysogenum]KAJ5255516.1 hypothetical protein N7505_010667 [Penicillium chrysogenum]